MLRDTVNYLVVGIFVVVIFLAFLVVLYQITGRSGPTDTYFVNYGNVDGIKYGTPVTYEGYLVGQVEEVEPIREGGGTHFKLTLSVIEGWAIPNDSVAQVVKSGLLASVAINVEEGKSATPFPPESTLPGQEAADLFGAVSDLASDVRGLMRDSVRPLLDNLNTQINALSGDARSIMRDSLKPILDDQVKKLLDSANSVLSEENQQNIDDTLANLKSASENMNELLTRVEESRKNLDKLLADADELVGTNKEDVRAAVTDLKRSLNAISQHIES